MKNKLLKYGIIISILGFILYFIPIVLMNEVLHITDFFIADILITIIYVGFIMLFVGIVLAILGIVVGYIKKSNVLSKRNCPKCGRKIQFEARVCPFCKKDFEED